MYALGVTFFRLLTGLWYEPGTDALSLLEPLEGPWCEILPPMLADERGLEADSDDVVQEIFMRLVAVLRDGRVRIGGDAGRFRRYLATLVRNELISRWRKNAARGAGVSVSLDDPSSGVEPSVDSDVAAVVDAKWRLARHRAAVEWALTKTALSAQSKAVYRAYALDGRLIGEVAAEFGIPRNSVSQIKTRVERMVAAIEAEF